MLGQMVQRMQRKCSENGGGLGEFIFPLISPGPSSSIGTTIKGARRERQRKTGPRI